MYIYNHDKEGLTVKYIFVNHRWSQKKRKEAWEYCKGCHAQANTENVEDITWDEREILDNVMKGIWGNWVSNQKPRVQIKG